MTKLGQHSGAKCRDFIESEGCVGIFDFARATGYSYGHVYRQVRIGKLPATKREGVWMIPRAVLDQVRTQIVAGGPDGQAEGSDDAR